MGHIIGHPDIQTLDFLDFICGILRSSVIITRNGNMKCTAVSHFGCCNLNRIRSYLKKIKLDAQFAYMSGCVMGLRVVD
jgi:hypothetical protein